MKKMLYVSPILIDKNNLDGVGKKVFLHANSFASYFDTDIAYNTKECFVIENINSNTIKKNNSKLKINRNIVLCETMKLEKQYDYCYIRYPKADPLLLHLLKVLKNKKTKIVLEIPTYPYDNSHIRSLSEFAIKTVDFFYRNSLKKYVDRIITYSDDNEIFGIKTIKTVNGIEFNESTIVTSKCNDIINLVAVSSMYIINGYERIIEGLREYRGKKEVIFHLVGDGPEIKKYKKIVLEYNLENKVKFYGNKIGQELETIYKEMNIGVNSLAIHRQNLKKESTLKSREYVSHGLPVISSTSIDALNKEGNKKYVYLVNQNEESVDIEKIVEWYTNLCVYKDYQYEIFEFGRNTCEIDKTLHPIVSYLRD